MSTDAFLEYLKKRQGLLEGVCVSGGEPTGDPGLEKFLTDIKALGYAVKLDTNGSRPAVLKNLLQKGLVDYVAVDAKNSPEKYPETVGCACDVAAVEESMRLLIDGDTPYELRTTLVAQLHDAASIEAMGKWLAALVPGKKPAQLFLQSFVDRDTVAYSGLCAPTENDVVRFADILTPFIGKVTIRNL
jgi:pyruvate formate lyase activating enzyme